MNATTVNAPTLAALVASALLKALRPVYEKLGVVPFDVPTENPADRDLPVEPGDADEAPSAFADVPARVRQKVDRWLHGQRRAVFNKHGENAPRVFAEAHRRAYGVARSWEALRRARETRYTLEDYLHANVGARL